MKNLIAMVVLCFVSISFAASAQKKFDLKMDLSVNGKHISSPTIVITEGDPSTVTQETKEGKFFITASTMAPPKDLSPKNPQNKKVISLQFVVGKITADGKETILSRPQIIALEGQKASITVEDKKETMSLSVTATAL